MVWMGWDRRGGANFRNEDRIRLPKETIKGAFRNEGGGGCCMDINFGLLYMFCIFSIF